MAPPQNASRPTPTSRGFTQLSEGHLDDDSGPPPGPSGPMWSEENEVKSKNTFTTQWMKINHSSEKSVFPRLTMILKYLKLYCRNSSLNSLKYLADSQRPWFERILWVIIHNLTISFLVVIVYTSYQEYVTTPLVTSMETDNYKTTNLSFPGIKIKLFPRTCMYACN
ncbi:sodium channel protein Nach-like [Solenopsis invicta]|uniref:sodium channel protein Nach-like n=1 Tax=Solenopsis invicta TaxID=13686 RepID=UPI00193DB66A|nr:sodium channel protein Nach-like [Solenopsis invicta]